MITAQDVAAPAFVAPPQWTPPPAVPAAARTTLREGLLHLTLFLVMLGGCIAFIEPSPQDMLMVPFAVACVVAGVRFERPMLPFFLLIVLWNIGGLLALINVIAEEKTVQYAVTSVYMAVAAILYTCAFAQNSLARLKTMEIGYTIAAFLAAIMGIIGYFRIGGHISELFLVNDRATGAFKDPNVFGPFLILPALIIVERIMIRRIALLDLGVLGVILFGLFLSFSRGAWFHFGVSCAVMLGLSLFTASTHRVRLRIITFTAIGLAAIAGLLLFALTFHAISDMFSQRAQLIQSYDVGDAGRFRLQEIAVGSVLDYPIGLGPFEFSRIFGLQQHNVYLQAFLVYGWFGGLCYVLMVLVTLVAGLRAAFVATPWRHYLFAAYGAFVGEVLESFIIDSDHWRHYFIILGVLWGLTVATIRQQRQAAQTPAASYG